MSKNIVYITLTAKLRELEQMDKALDEEYKKNKAGIKKDIQELKNAIILTEINEATENTLIKPKRGRKPILFDESKYPFTGSLKNKMLYALHEKNRFLHVREIADYIISKQPGENRDVIIEQLGKHFYKHRQKGIVVSINATKSRRDVFWGLPDWLYPDGTIKDDHDFDADQLQDKDAYIRELVGADEDLIGDGT